MGMNDDSLTLLFNYVQMGNNDSLLMNMSVF